MKITRRQIRRLIREWFSDEHDPATGKRDQYEPETLSLEDAKELQKKYRLNMNPQQLWDRYQDLTYADVERKLEQWAGKMRPTA